MATTPDPRHPSMAHRLFWRDAKARAERHDLEIMAEFAARKEAEACGFDIVDAAEQICRDAVL